MDRTAALTCAPRDAAFDVEDLRRRSLEGFLAVERLAGPQPLEVPIESGVYAIVRTATTPPAFLERSGAGRWKAKDPTVPLERLEREWVKGAQTLYIGKAKSLRERVGELLEFARGLPKRHYGGRLIGIGTVPDADVRLGADGFVATVGERAEIVDRPATVWGALLAACIGASAAFHRAVGRRGALADGEYSLWELGARGAADGPRDQARSMSAEYSRQVPAPWAAASTSPSRPSGSLASGRSRTATAPTSRTSTARRCSSTATPAG